MIRIEYRIQDGKIQLESNIDRVIPQRYKRFPYNDNGGNAYYDSCSMLLKTIKECFESISPIDSKLDGYYTIYVLLHVPADLENYRNCKKTDRSHKKTYDYGQGIFINEGEKLPIIHFCRKDILSAKESKYFRRNIFIMDSSIWNYFIPYKRSRNKIDIDANRLKSVIKTISCDQNRGLYKLSVSHEYAELNARKTRESHLIDIEGHGSDVSPFVFHSERKMSDLIEMEFKQQNTIQDIIDKKWRLLLVDDKANSPMSTFDKSSVQLNKIDIVTDSLKENFNNLMDPQHTVIIQSRSYGSLLSNTKFDILIEYAETIEEADKALKEKEYDIILLDYKIKQGNITRYGYEILNQIKNSKEDYKNGPHGTSFFMFISAYPSAVYERLWAEGINLNEVYWNIKTGACPTNTPQLFIYYLLNFMYRRLERLGINRLSPKRILEQIHVIFSPEEGKTVREMADEQYQNVLSLQYHYRSMIKDVDIPAKGESLFNIKGSVLVTDFIQQNEWLGGFLEHLSHLVYLVAFGTTRQYAEMWEEYRYIRSKLDKIQSLSEEEKAKRVNACKCIEQYISNLKQQQR